MEMSIQEMFSTTKEMDKKEPISKPEPTPDTRDNGKLTKNTVEVHIMLQRHPIL